MSVPKPGLGCSGLTRTRVNDVYGMEGSDRDLAGGVGNDNLYGGLGGDGDSDNVYCDEGTDTAVVEVGDLVGTTSGSSARRCCRRARAARSSWSRGWRGRGPGGYKAG